MSVHEILIPFTGNALPDLSNTPSLKYRIKLIDSHQTTVSSVKSNMEEDFLPVLEHHSKSLKKRTGESELGKFKHWNSSVTSDELTHCKTFFFGPGTSNWSYLFSTSNPPAKDSIAYAASELHTRTIDHKFHCIRISHSSITNAFLIVLHAPTIHNNEVLPNTKSDALDY